MFMNHEINFFAQLNYRGRKDKFGIKTDDRRRHMYVVGKTGMGKTVMLQNMAIQDIVNGHAVGVVDPHGEFADELLYHVPKERISDVVYFNPSDYEHPMGLNVLENINFDQRHLVASGLMGVFKKLWPDVWSARMEYILNNAILALLEYPDATLLGVNRMFSNPGFRKNVIEHVTDPVVRSFWLDEYANYTQRLEVEATAAIQNKVGQFVSAPLIRNIVGQVKSTVDIRKTMDDGKIFIANLSKGKIGEDNARLLGSMLMTKVYLAAMSRVDIPEEKRRDFFFFVDEFQNFQSKAFADVLSEARKYRLSLILAHQYVAQMDEDVAPAVFGNVGTIVSFRIGAQDAEEMEKEFAPEFALEDFVNLGKYNVILKLMIDGLASRGFSAVTLPPIVQPSVNYKEEALEKSREQFTAKRADVEEYIRKWHEELADVGMPRGTSGPSSSSSSASGRSSRDGSAPRSGGQRTSAASPLQDVMKSASSKLQTGGSSGEGAAPSRAAEPNLFEATCTDCGKRTVVPFRPDGTRPIYCKKCRKERFGPKVPSNTEGPKRSLPAPKSDAPAASVAGKSDEAHEEIHEAGKQSLPKNAKREVDITKVRDSLKEFMPPNN